MRLGSPEVNEWFQRERGISSETLEYFQIQTNDKNDVLIPYPEGTKVRTGLLTGERDFYWAKDSKQTLFNIQDAGKPIVFICEGETDTMRLWQETEGKVGVVGLPGISSWKSDYADLFRSAEQIYVVLDNDTNYNVQAQVDEGWRNIRRDLGPRAKRIRLLPGVKDVCEFFQAGLTLDDLKKLIAQPVSRFKPLDLSSAHIPRPVNWLVGGLIGQGDVSLVIGEPGVGKSWLTMSLALGLVQGWETWLGLPLAQRPGARVLIVDEENPEDVVLDRLVKLGLRDRDVPQIRYLHEQGVRLDKDPDAILEEAIAFEPTLIVLDSLTRLHTENENDAGAIARLFNDGVKPLARQTGATVALLHHARKPQGEASGFVRARGSGDITASVDTGLDVRQTGPGWLRVVHFKSRRRLPRPPIEARLLDVEDNGRPMVRLVTNVEAPPPF